jgi:hypothetical protein
MKVMDLSLMGARAQNIPCQILPLLAAAPSLI